MRARLMLLAYAILIASPFPSRADDVPIVTQEWEKGGGGAAIGGQKRRGMGGAAS